jgi:WD40 repeat protein
VAATLEDGWLARPAGIRRHQLDPLLPSRYLAPRRGVPAAETPALHRVLTGHTYEVNAAAFSPHGWQLASADADGTVRL